jgi:hypothetical protein
MKLFHLVVLALASACVATSLIDAAPRKSLHHSKSSPHTRRHAKAAPWRDTDLAKQAGLFRPHPHNATLAEFSTHLRRRGFHPKRSAAAKRAVHVPARDAFRHYGKSRRHGFVELNVTTELKRETVHLDEFISLFLEYAPRWECAAAAEPANASSSGALFYRFTLALGSPLTEETVAADAVAVIDYLEARLSAPGAHVTWGMLVGDLLRSPFGDSCVELLGANLTSRAYYGVDAVAVAGSLPAGTLTLSLDVHTAPVFSLFKSFSHKLRWDPDLERAAASHPGRPIPDLDDPAVRRALFGAPADAESNLRRRLQTPADACTDASCRWMCPGTQLNPPVICGGAAQGYCNTAFKCVCSAGFSGDGCWPTPPPGNDDYSPAAKARKKKGVNGFNFNVDRAADSPRAAEIDLNPDLRANMPMACVDCYAANNVGVESGGSFDISDMSDPFSGLSGGIAGTGAMAYGLKLGDSASTTVVEYKTNGDYNIPMPPLPSITL